MAGLRNTCVHEILKADYSADAAAASWAGRNGTGAIIGSLYLSSAADVRKNLMEYEPKELQQMQLRCGESARGPTGIKHDQDIMRKDD